MRQTKRKKNILSITFLLLVAPFNLLKASDLPKVNQEAIDSLIAVSYQYFLKLDIENNIETANKTLMMSKELDYSGGKAKSYFYLARAFSYLGEYNKSLEYLQLSEREPYITHNPDIHSEICRIRGQIYMYLGLFSSSINEFHKGLYYVNQIKDKDKRAYTTSLAYENLSISYKNNQQYDSMLYYLNKNKEILSKQSLPQSHYSRLNLHTLYGDYYTTVEKYDSASYCFNQALAIVEEHHLHYTSWIDKHRGNMEFKRNNLDLALEYYQAALNNLRETQMVNELPELYKQIAKVYEKKEIQDSVLFYTNKATEIENKLLNEKQKTVEKALKIIVEEEQNKLINDFKSRIVLFAYIIAGIFIVAGIIWLRWRKGQRKKLEEMETEFKDMELRLSENVQELMELAKANDSTFITCFIKTFPTFTHNIYAKHPDLISSEFWFCAMLFLDFSSKEIAQYSFVEHRSVQIRKSRLRKKLKIDSNIDLYHYIKSFYTENPI